MTNILKKFLRSPFEFTKHILTKTILYPIKYGKKNDYDAARYWDDRFKQHDGNVKSVGIEGLSEAENHRQRLKAKEVFQTAVKKYFQTFSDIAVLEIGCGTGFYTEMLKELQVKNYTALDITDAYFPQLKKQFPEYHFTKKDVTTEKHSGHYNLIAMMDVVEHIVTDEKLEFALEMVKRCLTPSGVFLIVPCMETAKRHLFHVRYWSIAEVSRYFPKDQFDIELTLARDKEYLLTIKKKIEHAHLHRT